MRIGFVILDKNVLFDMDVVKERFKEYIKSAHKIDIYRTLKKWRIIMSLDETDFEALCYLVWKSTNVSRIHKFQT